MIRFDCSGCGQKFSVKEDIAGRKANCPQCGELFRVPENPPPPVPNPYFAGPKEDPSFAVDINEEFHIDESSTRVRPNYRRRSAPGRSMPIWLIVMLTLFVSCCGMPMLVGLLMPEHREAPKENIQDAGAKKPDAQAPEKSVVRDLNHGDITICEAKIALGGVSYSFDSDTLEQYIGFLAESHNDAASGMIDRGQIRLLKSGTRLKIRTRTIFSDLYKVDVLDGPQAGLTIWVHKLEVGDKAKR